MAQEAGNTIDLYVILLLKGFYHIFVSSSSEPSKIRHCSGLMLKAGFLAL